MKKLLSGLLIFCSILGLFTAVQATDATLYFSRDSLTLSVGRYVTVHVYVNPAGAIRDDVLFSVSDESVASVSKDGKVRGLKAGVCELTATSKYDKAISVTIPVAVIVPVERVDIAADANSLILGETLKLSATVEPEGATMQDVGFSSSDETVATVTKDGLVTGVKRGQAVITAVTADGRASDSMRVTVKQPPESVTVSPEAVTVAEGKTKQLQAAVLPKNTDDKTVLWTSADESVATVSDRGVVTGVLLGETVITAACKDNVNATFTVPVTVLKLASGVAFTQDSYDVLLNGTVQLSHTVFPSETSDQSVTYKVGNSRIASVDLSGLVSALKGGTTTVTVSTADGSRKSDTATVRVVVPVTGVTYPYTDI
ncbi:MAG: Ig-like domain-containing protein, partial [Bacillota bacterium]